MVDVPNWGTCADCGAAMDMKPFVFHTDVRGQAFHSVAAGRDFTSRREQENYMRDSGYREAGDKVGGAREETALQDRTYSYASQGSKTTGSERARDRETLQCEARRGTAPDVMPVG